MRKLRKMSPTDTGAIGSVSLQGSRGKDWLPGLCLSLESCVGYMFQSASDFVIQGRVGFYILELAVRFLLAACAIVFATGAEAQTLWNHNGSIVKLFANGDQRQFIYAVPDPHLPVKVGDIVFDGVKNGNQYGGTAFLRSPRCGAISYSVSGPIADDQRGVTLYGQAPVRDPKTCKVTGYRNDVLAFNFIDVNADIPTAHQEVRGGGPVAGSAAGNELQGANPTVVCLQPIFEEEERLREQINGDRNVTVWVAQAINYLHGKYCGKVMGAPVSDQTVGHLAGGACTELSGIYQGERLYWEECHE